jgi:hypothetical protein
MNKIYLNQYLSIVLSVVSLLAFANNAYLVNILFQLTAVNKDVFSDTGFQLKFFETVFYAVIYLSISLYFALTALKNFPVIEFGKDSKSKKEDSE